MVPCDFDALFSKCRPHILEKICLSLDYNTFKNCLEVNSVWKGILKTKAFQEKAKSVFNNAILEDQCKLVRVSKEGNANEVKRLLSVGMADVDCVDDVNGETPLYKAACRGHKDVVQMLLKGGADPNRATNYGYMVPLHTATTWGHHGVVQVLLDGGADINKASSTGDTPLLLGVANCHRDVVELLLDRGADPNKANNDGETPLHWGRLERGGLVHLLLDRGADPSKTDCRGRTPFWLTLLQ